MKRVSVFATFLIAFCAGCGTSWDFGHNQSFARDGWSIHLHNVPNDAVIRSDAGATINTGGHSIVINNGVTIDGRELATGPKGEVTITQNIGTVTLAINGHEVETD
jgi:hypothetical protein